VKQKIGPLKTHADRKVPLTRELLAMIEKRKRKGATESKWLFPNAEAILRTTTGSSATEAHREARRSNLRTIASRRSRRRPLRVNKRREVVCCADDCQYANNTICIAYARRRRLSVHNAGVPLRTIQKWAGHKSIEPTMIYLGVQDSDELQEQINVRKY